MILIECIVLIRVPIISYTVPKKEVREFSREEAAKVENPALAEAVEKALKFIGDQVLPIHWDRNALFNTHSQYTDSEEYFSDVSNFRIMS